MRPVSGHPSRRLWAELRPDSPDVDECLEQLDECHYNQLCENTVGGHRCGCARGYRIQGPGLPCLGTGRPALTGPWWWPGAWGWWLLSPSSFGPTLYLLYPCRPPSLEGRRGRTVVSIG